MQISRPLKIYIAYLLIACFFQIVLVSLSLFFHFQLAHNTMVLEEWLQRNQWSLVGFSKVMSLAITLRWLGNPIVFKYETTHWRDEWMALLFFLPLLLWIGRPQFIAPGLWQWDLVMATYIGSAIHLGIDLWLWKYFFPRQMFDQTYKWDAVIWPILASLSSFIFFPSRPLWNLLVALHFLTLSLKIFLDRGGLGYVLIFAAPLAVIWGADFWPADTFGMATWQNPIRYYHLLVLWPIYIVFIFWNHRLKRPIKIATP